MNEQIEKILFPFDVTVASKQKIFIVEGPDCSGKTTVCRFFSKLYKLPIVHLTYFPNQKEMEKQFERVYQLIHGLLHYRPLAGIIFDRFVASNRIYSNVLKNSLPSEWLEKIEELLNTTSRYYDVTFINCLPEDKQNYLNHYKEIASKRKELCGDDLEVVSSIYDEYKILFDGEKHGCEVNTFSYDFMSECQFSTVKMDELFNNVIFKDEKC